MQPQSGTKYNLIDMEIVVTRQDGSVYPLVVHSQATNITQAKQTWTLLGDDVVDISIDSPYPQQYNVGDEITVFGRKYKINRLPSVRKLGNHHYSYNIRFEGVQYDLLSVIYELSVETTNNTLQDVQADSLVGDLKRFATVLIANANRVYPRKWELGNCPETIEDKSLTFGDNDNCLSVLHRLCNEFGVEVDINQDDDIYVVNFVEKLGQVYPITFEFGKGRGLYELTRQNVDSSNVVTRLKVYGSSDNITHKYRAARLCLPGKSKASSFIEKSHAVTKYGIHEARKVFDDIKPTFNGRVTSVVTGDVFKFVDNTMFDLNEKDENDTKYLLNGVTAKIHFNSGNLAGYEFEIKGYDHATHTFTLAKITDDRGSQFPSESSSAFQIAVGDKYKILDIALPERYEKEAEQKLLEEANKYYDQNCQPKVKYGLSVTKSFIEKSLEKGMFTAFTPGDYLPVRDESIGVDKAVRIQSIQRDLMDKYNYTLTISDTVEVRFAERIISELIDSENVAEGNKNKLLFALRRLENRTYQDVLTTKALIDALELKQFTDSISPKTISTIQGIFGMPECQFKFVKTKTDTTEVSFVFSFRRGGTELYIPSQYIAKEKQSDTLTSSKEWVVHHVPELTYSLKDDETSLYLYAQLSSGGNKFVLTKEPLPLTAENNLVGLVTGLAPSRQLTTMYGVTEITPGQVMTKMIRSASGNVYWDLVTGDLVIGDPKGNTCLAWIGGKLYIKGIMVTVGGKETTIERALQDQTNKIDNINVGTRNLIRGGKKLTVRGGVTIIPAEDAVAGDEYVLSVGRAVNIQSGRYDSTRFLIYDEQYKVNKRVRISDTRQSVKFTVGVTGLRIALCATISWGGVTEFYDIILTKGNQIVDFVEAPEDIEERYQKLISNVDVEFALGDSMTTSPSSGWQTTAPAPQTGKYLWQRTKTTLKDGNVTYKGVTCIQGKNGTDGAKGRGVKSVTEQYYHSTSMTALTGGGWGSVAPTPAPGKWIWTRSVIAYDDSTSTTTSPVCVTGDKGAKGDDGAPGKDGKDAINYSAGLLLYGDPTFTEGVNWTTRYNNAGGNTTTWERITKPADCPSSSTHAMSYKYLGGGSTGPGYGGFTYHTTSRANAVFVYRIIAKIPVGYKISYATNPYGDGGTQHWLTEDIGTGKYEEYVVLVKCGSTGTFSSIGFFYFYKSSVNTPNAPFEVIVSYATAFDMTSAPNYYQQLGKEQRAREEAEKAFAEANKKALDAAQRAYEKALSAAKYHGQYGEYSPTIKYPYTERETSVVIYKGVPYVLTGEHTAGVAPDSTAGKKIWQAISSMEALCARKVLADYAQIGDMMLYNGEGSDDFIAFEHKDDSGEIHRYMQIGGRAKTENEMLDQSTSDVISYSVRPLYTSTSGTHVVDRYDSKEGNRLVKYTADLAVAAVAECEWELIDGEGFYQSRSSSVEAKLKIVVKARSGGVKYERESDPVTTTATTPTMHESYFDPDKAIVRTFKVAKITLSVEAARINRYDQVELQLVLNGTGERYTASVTDVFNYMPQDKSKSIMTVARDKISFFFGRSKYILFNYLNHYLIKIVGNVMLQGDLHVTGDLNADFIETSGAVLAGGEVNANGMVAFPFGRYHSHPTKGVDYVEKLGSGQSCYTRVWHSIGSDKYVPFVTPTNVPWSDQASIVDKQANYFDVRFYNTSGQSYHYPFNYICYRAD